jgi:riboflavin biosynthesis pyrimidine reductase
MRDFQVLFDHGERSELADPVYAAYGELGFPPPPRDRPWIFTNFVQTLDGVVSLLGSEASGSDISQSPEDRWLMDLLRAHADAILIGMGTLRVEAGLGRPGPRGPVFRIVDPAIRKLREKLQRGLERNIFLTGSSDIQLERYAAFDGKQVDPFLLTTREVGEKLAPQLRQRPHVRVIVCGEGQWVDLEAAMLILRHHFGIRYLLCEGGPTMYSNLLDLDLIDEKFLTVSPIEVGSYTPQSEISETPLPIRPTAFAGGGLSKEEAVHWEWMSCRKVGNHQFHRFRRKRDKKKR